MFASQFIEEWMFITLLYSCVFTLFCLWSEHQKKELFSTLQKPHHNIASVS